MPIGTFQYRFTPFLQSCRHSRLFAFIHGLTTWIKFRRVLALFVQNFLCVFQSFCGFNESVNLDSYRAFALELAEKSGEFIRPFFANPGLVVETKSDLTPVT